MERVAVVLGVETVWAVEVTVAAREVVAVVLVREEVAKEVDRMVGVASAEEVMAEVGSVEEA